MSTATLLTLEQFEQLPDDGARYELKDGELVKMADAKGGTSGPNSGLSEV